MVKRKAPAPRAPIHTTAEYKRQVLTELEGAKSKGDVTRILRRERLPHSAIARWRRQAIEEECVPRTPAGELVPLGVLKLARAELTSDKDVRAQYGLHLKPLVARVTVWLLRRHSTLSYKQISRALSRDVSTVYYAGPQLEQEMRDDERLRGVVERLERKIAAPK